MFLSLISNACNSNALKVRCWIIGLPFAYTHVMYVYRQLGTARVWEVILVWFSDLPDAMRNHLGHRGEPSGSVPL